MWSGPTSKLQQAIANAYGVEDIPPVDTLAEIAKKWRPFGAGATASSIRLRFHEFTGAPNRTLFEPS